MSREKIYIEELEEKYDYEIITGSCVSDITDIETDSCIFEAVTEITLSYGFGPAYVKVEYIFKRVLDGKYFSLILRKMSGESGINSDSHLIEVTPINKTITVYE